MGETVEFPSNGQSATGYLAVPRNGGGPGVIVIQEWWGLVPHIEDVCERFASEGFVALAPDLFHGKTTKEPDEASKLMMEMQLDVAGRDMVGAGRWLAAQERTAGDRVGIVGFCMGGALALYAASLSDVFGAVVGFYPAFGRTESARPDYARIRGAVLAHFAEEDDYYDHQKVDEFADAVRQGGADVEVHWYVGAGHAFFNDHRPEVHHPEHSRLAWDRTVAFLRKHLAATPAPV
jgi:carboxymethylenebutenolidase